MSAASFKRLPALADQHVSRTSTTSLKETAMNDLENNACDCFDCPGDICACGCQSSIACACAPTCTCGVDCQCGPSCACDSTKEVSHA